MRENFKITNVQIHIKFKRKPKQFLPNEKI